MHELESQDEMIGKTVADYSKHGFNHGQHIITFTDGTFITYKVIIFPDGDAEIERRELDISRFSENECIRLGIYTAEEYEQWEADRKSKWEAERKRRELAQLKQLKEKYPDV